MLVKCLDNGEKIERENAYRVTRVLHHKDGTVSDKYDYYSSEEAYLKIREDKDYWNKSMQKMMDILDYRPGMALPTVVSMRFSELRGYYGMRTIYDTICECADKNMFAYAQGQSFKSEYTRAKYYTSIIVNNIEDVRKHNEYKLKATTNNSVDNLSDINIENKVGTKKVDISRFLEV